MNTQIARSECESFPIGLPNQCSQLLHSKFMLSVAKAIATDNDKIPVTFSRLSSKEDWLTLGKFRLENYAIKKSYMVAELNSDGFDNYDRHARVYAAWLNKEIIASIRLCSFPFETLQFVSEKKLARFLGGDYQKHYLEWSRLLINSKVTSHRLLPAIIVYAGMDTLSTTSYSNYFGYSTPLIRRLFSKFQLADDVLEFTIERRGAH